MKNIVSFVIKLIVTIGTVLILAVLVTGSNNLSGNSGTLSVFGYWPVVIVTGSMEPTIKTDSLNICKRVKIEDVNIGDIIAFEYQGKLITHRVVNIGIDDKGNIVLTTKGDANGSLDGVTVTSEKLKGVIVKTWNDTADFIGSRLVVNEKLDVLEVSQVALIFLIFVWLIITGLVTVISNIVDFILAGSKGARYSKALDSYMSDISYMLVYKQLLEKLKDKEVDNKDGVLNRIARAKVIRTIGNIDDDTVLFRNNMKKVMKYDKLDDYLNDSSDRSDESNNTCQITDEQ